MHCLLQLTCPLVPQAGSTGPPKRAMLTHDNVCGSCSGLKDGGGHAVQSWLLLPLCPCPMLNADCVDGKVTQDYLW